MASSPLAPAGMNAGSAWSTCAPTEIVLSLVDGLQSVRDDVFSSNVNPPAQSAAESWANASTSSGAPASSVTLSVYDPLGTVVTFALARAIQYMYRSRVPRDDVRVSAKTSVLSSTGTP